MLRDVHKHALLVALIPVVFTAASSLAQVSPEKEAREVFQKLVSVAGVSSHEEKVQEAIRELLPKGVKPQVDDMNNLVVVLGSGKPELLFVAHMDEIGLEVTEINQDGTLRTRERGGFYSTTWESKVVKIHTKTGVVDGVIGPRLSPFPSPFDERSLFETEEQVKNIQYSLACIILLLAGASATTGQTTQRLRERCLGTTRETL